MNKVMNSRLIQVGVGITPLMFSAFSNLVLNNKTLTAVGLGATAATMIGITVYNSYRDFKVIDSRKYNHKNKNR